METQKTPIFLTYIALLSCGVVFAGPGPPPPAGPPGPPGLPIDNGLSILLIIALCYGIYCIKKNKLHKKRLS